MEISQKPPVGKKIKARAPPPPRYSSSKARMEHTSSSESDGAGNQITEESEENVLHRKVDLTICFPNGQQKIVTVDGSKAIMDFLVDLCCQHHLNPAQHALEVRSSVSQQPLTLRPNTLIGTLDVQTVFLKEKVTEVKVRKPAPKIPEKTVRLVVNFLGTQKAVVRVNPAVPLQNIFPAVCEKCEFNHENVIFLRDAVSKEELDMSQSLNDLGIKELYAWHKKQENNLNYSSSSDTTEKEKKGISGFFRSYKKGHKNEGSIGNLDSDDYEEVFKTASTSGNRCEGFSTAPSSPSVNSRPTTLGASLSLSNIASIGSGSEMKKRKAPPPPKIAVPVNAEKTPEQKSVEPIYATVQKEEKKKRKAPPPPSLPMPYEKNEDLENSRSSTGNGRQVPQKPPRGTTRSPPQLMIPPPPPYPPPDNDITDPPVFENGATGLTRPIPAKREKHLNRCNRVSSEEKTSTDDGGSVNSCTEDSGIVSTPSDNVSLDLQNDDNKTKNLEKNIKSDTANLKPIRANSNSEDTLSLHTSPIRDEDEVTLVKKGEEEHFIAAHFQQTLAELYEGSEDADGDSGHSNTISSQSSTLSEETNPYHDPRQDSYSVPVTIIDVVTEINPYSPKESAANLSPPKEYNTTHQTPVLVSTKSVNYVSADGESVARKINAAYNKDHQVRSQKGKSSMDRFKKSKDNFISETTKNDYQTNTSYQQNITKEKPSSNGTLYDASQVKDKVDLIPDQKQKVENPESRVTQNNANKVKEPTKPALWRQQTYEPKVGMTTFTVVPPKPDVKKYNRHVSLTANAIKIDDLGNLISPQSSFDKDINDSQNNETEGPLVEKAKEFWRSNSMDSQAVDSKDSSVKRLISVKSHKPNQASENKPKSPSSPGSIAPLPINKLTGDNGSQQTKPVPKADPQMIIIENTSKGRTEMPFLKPVLNKRMSEIQQTKTVIVQPENMTIIQNNIWGNTTFNNKNKESLQSKPVQHSTMSHERMIILEQTNKERKDLTFLKPSSRTSSQYVASAIFKCTERKSIETTEAKQEANCINRSLLLTSKTNTNFTLEGPKVENKQETSTQMRTSNINQQLVNKNPETDSITKHINDQEKLRVNIIKEPSLSEQQRFNGSHSFIRNTSETTVEKSEKTSGINSSAPTDSIRRPLSASGVPSNAFLKAVREKSSKIDQANLFCPIKAPPAPEITAQKDEKRKLDVPSTIIDEPDNSDNNINFGPKAKLRPVVQKSMPKDTSLHTVLMGAIQSGEGKDKLRKIQSSPTDGEDRKFAEPENERSALLSAIRGHNGISRLKKVSSAASDEMEGIRNTELSWKDDDFATTNSLSIPPPPLMPPPPPPPPVLTTAPNQSPVLTNNSVDTREALMEAIRSGAGALQLKKVSASVQHKRKF